MEEKIEGKIDINTLKPGFYPISEEYNQPEYSPCLAEKANEYWKSRGYINGK